MKTKSKIMEFKKKTIIWEDNNEPPKDYIWAKKDGKFYEYSYATRSWVESKLIKAEGSGLTGDPINDWVAAVTQCQYTTYEDVPEADKAGLIEGWRRESSQYKANIPIHQVDAQFHVSFFDNHAIYMNVEFVDNEILL